MSPKKPKHPADAFAIGSSLPTLVTVIGPKTNLGKSLVARAVICRYVAAGQAPRIVQIDRNPALVDTYGDEVITVTLPSTDEQREDPLATIKALEPYAFAIDASLGDGRPLVTDVGGGPLASTTVDYIGRSRLDAYLKGRACSVVVVVLTCDPHVMQGGMELAVALERAYPNARFVCALNRRDGPFRFEPGSEQDRIMRERIQPFIERHAAITVKALPAGALLPFEAKRLRFTDIIAAEPEALARQLTIHRGLAAVIQGDVA